MGDPFELKARLNAAVRELATVVDELPTETASIRSARSEVSEAQRAMEEAIAAAATANLGPDGLFATELTEDLQAAQAMRAEACHARDLKELELLSLQSEHAELLRRLHEFADQRDRDTAHSHDDAQARQSHARLLAQCGDLGGELAARRGQLDATSHRLEVCGKRGQFLGYRRRRLLRFHVRSLAQNVGAREILAMQEETHAHMKTGFETALGKDHDFEEEQRLFTEKVDRVKNEWEAHQAEYKEEIASLEAALTQVQHDYEERWRATAREGQHRLDKSMSLAAEQRKAYQKQLELLDLARESEAAKARDNAEQQRLLVDKVRNTAAADLEDALDKQRKQMQEEYQEERKRCHTLRRQETLRAKENRKTVLETRNVINEIKHHYALHNIDGVALTGEDSHALSVSSTPPSSSSPTLSLDPRRPSAPSSGWRTMS
jgi:hypothetical protein